jgi:hypothetical protein
MPLPSVLKHGAKLCSAKSKRTGLPCNNPAAFGCKTCRMHGARRPDSIKRGKDHPNFVHGERSLEGIQRHRETRKQLRILTFICNRLGFLKRKLRGRKILINGQWI